MKRKVFHTRAAGASGLRPDREIWDREYSEPATSVDVDFVYRDEHWEILRRAGVLQGLVLEAGCGYGQWVLALRDHGIRVVGVDFSRVGLGRLKQCWPEAPAVLGDIRRLPLRAESLDAVLSFGVLEHLEEGPAAALEEAFRCLKPGGVLVVSVPRLSLNRLLDPWLVVRRAASGSNLLRRWFGKGEKVFLQYEFTDGHFGRELSRAGFRVFKRMPIWVGHGLREDFRSLSPPLERSVARWRNSPRADRVIRAAFGAFVLFLCAKD